MRQWFVMDVLLIRRHGDKYSATDPEGGEMVMRLRDLSESHYEASN